VPYLLIALGIIGVLWIWLKRLHTVGPVWANRLQRSGISALELLVVSALLGILMALLVPAVQRVRQAANRISCANHLEHIGLGLHLHHDSYGVLPSNGGWGPGLIPAKDGSLFTPKTILFNEHSGGPRISMLWGVGEPGRAPKTQTGSWAYAILPYIEQKGIYDNRSWTVGVKLYSCPQRRLPTPQLPVDDEHGRYIGGGWEWGKIDYAANGHLIENRPECSPMSIIRDGLSMTILIGEKAMDPLMYTAGGWYYDEPFFLGGSWGTKRSGTGVFKDEPGGLFMNNWGAAHAGGAQFLFADGAVRPVRFGVSANVMKALLSPHGGEASSDHDH
jgi:prepilin-type processing-associated H-X9-DG protein